MLLGRPRSLLLVFGLLLPSPLAHRLQVAVGRRNAIIASTLGRRAVFDSLAAGVAFQAASAHAASWENPFAAADRSGLKSRPLETLRILLQDEADAVQYGGSEGLAPGGAPPASGITLIPIVQMFQTLKKWQPVLNTFDAGAWAEVQLTISSGDFATVEFKRRFNAFSDNIYYSSESAEANAYMLGGATPSNAQTYQYLYRNEALKQLADLREEIAYQTKLMPEQRDVEVAQEYMAATLKAFEQYLKLAPPEQLKVARVALNLE